DYVLDRLQSLQWENVTLDAALHVTEPVAAVPAESLVDVEWVRFNALHGSWYESEIFRELLHADAISADGGIRLATRDGLRLLQLSPGSDTHSLNLPVNVLEDIARWLSRGFIVSTPETEIEHGDWRGAVWTVHDPETGSSGYFISGGLAGGATTQGDWPIEAYQNAVRAMYNDPQETSGPVGQIRKLGKGDWQLGGPGEQGESLMVQVVDILGNPVVGLNVNFSVLVGNAQLATTVATTDVYGVASVDVTFGTEIDASPINYRFLSPTDKYPTRVGTSLVDVWVADIASGTVHTREPFRLQLKPGDASVAMSQIIFPDAEEGRGGLPAGIVAYKVLDSYGNAVANADVTVNYDYTSSDPAFQAGGLVNEGDCTGQVTSLFCARPSVSAESTHSGQVATTFVNGRGTATQTLSLALNGQEGPTKTYSATFLEPELSIIGSVRLSGNAETQATRVGEKMKSKKFVRLAWPQRHWDAVERGKIYWVITTMEMITAAPYPDHDSL